MPLNDQQLETASRIIGALRNEIAKALVGQDGVVDRR